jgi:hypothetical protein
MMVSTDGELVTESDEGRGAQGKKVFLKDFRHRASGNSSASTPTVSTGSPVMESQDARTISEMTNRFDLCVLSQLPTRWHQLALPLPLCWARVLLIDKCALLLQDGEAVRQARADDAGADRWPGNIDTAHSP